MGDWTGSDLALAERVEEAARRFAPFCKPSLHWAFLVPSGEAEGMVVLPGALRGSVCRDGWRGIPVRSRVTGFLRHHPDADEDDAEHVVGEVVSACWMDGTDAVLGVLRFHDSDAGRLAYVAVEASWMLGARCIGLSLNGTTSALPGDVPLRRTVRRGCPPASPLQELRRAPNPVAAEVTVHSVDLVTRPAFNHARIASPVQPGRTPEELL